MSAFSAAELAYLTGEQHLGRLATVGADGMPHVVPVGWAYNPSADTVDVTGRDFRNTRKYHNAQANPKVAIVIDDVQPPWRPRAVLIQGSAEVQAGESMIRIKPTKVISWGLAG